MGGDFGRGMISWGKVFEEGGELFPWRNVGLLAGQ